MLTGSIVCDRASAAGASLDTSKLGGVALPAIPSKVFDITQFGAVADGNYHGSRSRVETLTVTAP